MGRHRSPQCIEAHGNAFLTDRTVVRNGKAYSVSTCTACNRERALEYRLRQPREVVYRPRPEPIRELATIYHPPAVVTPVTPHTDACSPWDGKACDECLGVWREVATA